MSAQLFTSSKYSATNAAGLPLSGGLVYTYAAGSLTKLATFTSQSGESPNTNPIVLDPAGRANVWLGPYAYRFIVKDASGVTMPDGDVDNITLPTAAVQLTQPTTDLMTGDGVTTIYTLSANPATVNNVFFSLGGAIQVPGVDYTLSGVVVTTTQPPPAGVAGFFNYTVALPVGLSDSATTTFVQAGVGAKSRTVQDKEREPGMSPQDFGAVGNGIANDFAAWSALILAANAAKARITVPPGTYLITDTLPTYTGPAIVGAGEGVCVLRFNTTGDCLVVKPATRYGNYSNLYITNAATGTAGTLGAVFRAQNVTQSRFSNIYTACDLDNYAGLLLEQVYDGTAADGDFLNHIGCWYNRFDNCSANYINSAAGNKGFGLRFSVNANAVGVVNPVGASAGTYTGSCNWNEVNGFNSEQRGRNIYLTRSTGNTFRAGKLLKGNELIYLDAAQHNNFETISLSEWVTQPVNVTNATAVSARNTFRNLTLFHPTFTLPWSIGTLSSTDTLLHTGDGYAEEQVMPNTLTNLTSFKVVATGAGIPKFRMTGQNNAVGFRGSSLSQFGDRSLVVSSYNETTMTETPMFSLGTDQAGQRDLRPEIDNTFSLGTASRRLSVIYAGTGTINTSDERTKTPAEPIPAAWLDAWADVEWSRFKFIDAVAEKGDGARWHVGLIAQRVQEAFARHGVDALAIGLLCSDVLDDGSERFGIRYEEALSLECAYLRSRINESKA